jgi:hypothetical protein
MEVEVEVEEVVPVHLEAVEGVWLVSELQDQQLEQVVLKEEDQVLVPPQQVLV